MTISYSPLPQRILKAHIQTTGNYEWVREHWDEIRAQYSEQFVAVAGCKVVYSAEKYSDILQYLQKHRNQPDLIAVRLRPDARVLLL